MASGMSCGDGGGFGSGSRSSSSAEFSEWHLREAEGSDVVTGTLKHCDNFTRYDELRSWDPTNFLMLQNGGQRTRQGIGLEPETCFCRSWMVHQVANINQGEGLGCLRGALERSLYWWLARRCNGDVKTCVAAARRSFYSVFGKWPFFLVSF